MKNIHVLPTDKPINLFKDIKNKLMFNKDWIEIPIGRVNQNIYITSDEEIKEGDWYLDMDLNKVCKNINMNEVSFNTNKKIILTTNSDLIKDGVQAIDDEFLEWFVKNPSCESIDVVTHYPTIDDEGDNSLSKQYYTLTIPKEEQDKKMYSEEEFLAFGKSCFYKGFEKAENDDANCYTAFREEIGNLFEQFKKK
jgi:hypothetical protein